MSKRTVHVVTRIERVYNRATGMWSDPQNFRLSVHDLGSWPEMMVKLHEAEMRKRIGSGVSESGHGTPSLPRVFLEEMSPGQPGTWMREIRFAILTEEQS